MNNYGIGLTVRDTKMRSKKVDNTYDLDKVFETSMFFTAGPNAGNVGNGVVPCSELTVSWHIRAKHSS